MNKPSNCYFILIVLGVSLAFIFAGRTMAEQAQSQESQESQEAQKEKKAQTSEKIQSPIPELKPDLPKLAVPKQETKPQRRQLKGSVQHREVVKPEGGQLQGKLNGSSDKEKLKLKANQYDSGISKTIESGLGIIGLKFAIYFGRTPIIYQVFPGTPAAAAGIKTRDTIIAVDGIPTFGLSKNEVYNMIVGKPGTEVTISYTHNHTYQTRTLTRMDVNAIPDPKVRRDYLSM